MWNIVELLRTFICFLAVNFSRSCTSKALESELIFEEALFRVDASSYRAFGTTKPQLTATCVGIKARTFCIIRQNVVKYQRDQLKCARKKQVRRFQLIKRVIASCEPGKPLTQVRYRALNETSPSSLLSVSQMLNWIVESRKKSIKGHWLLLIYISVDFTVNVILLQQ